MIRIFLTVSMLLGTVLAAEGKICDWEQSMPSVLKNVTRPAARNTWRICAEYPGSLAEAKKLMKHWLSEKGFSQKYDLSSPEEQKLVLSLWLNKDQKILLQYQELSSGCTEIKIGELK